MENFNLLTALFGSNPRLDLEHQVAVPVGDKEERLNSRRIEKNTKYEDEVNALAKHFGGLQAGTGLCITLQEILKICPRERKRSDAYNGLVSYLARNYHIELKIQSRKYGRKD
jgi:hypothetical protein